MCLFLQAGESFSRDQALTVPLKMEPSKGTRARDNHGDGLGAAAPSLWQRGVHGLRVCDEKPSPTPPRLALRCRRLRGWQHAAQPLRASPSLSGARRSHLQGDLREDASKADGTTEPLAARGQGQPWCRCPGWQAYTTALSWSCLYREQPRGHKHKQYYKAAVGQNTFIKLFAFSYEFRGYTYTCSKDPDSNGTCLREFLLFSGAQHKNLSPVKHQGAARHHRVFLISNPGAGTGRQCSPGHQRAPIATAKNWDLPLLSPSHKWTRSSFSSGEDRPSPPSPQPSQHLSTTNKIEAGTERFAPQG